jgi:radical SAM protein with 4Fe4S-binding SPASM domain
MDYQAVTNIIDKLHAAGFLWLCLTGGEPLLREDFPDIYAYAKKKGFIVIILTNATLISEKMVTLFAKLRPFYLEIPIHAAEPALYEKISGRKGSFGQFFKALKLLHENKIPFKLKTKLLTLNLDHLDQIRRFAEDLGSPLDISPTIHARLDGDQAPLRLRVSPEVMARCFSEHPPDEDCPLFSFPQKTKTDKKFLFKCAAVVGSVCVDPQGYLLSCVCVRQPRFDLKQGGFQEGFRLLLDEIPYKTFRTSSPCLSCKVMDLCEKCPGIAGLENKDPEAPLEYFCQVAKLRDG